MKLQPDKGSVGLFGIGLAAYWPQFKGLKERLESYRRLVVRREGRPILRGLSLYHGKRGSGISVEARVKLGPVTLLAMTQTVDGQLKLLAAEGESVAGPTLQIGNTNSRIKFKGGMTRFINQWCMEGPPHHCALGVGQVTPVVRNVASLLKLPFVEVR